MQTLVLLSTPLIVPILRALADGPTKQADLRHAAGSPALSTLRTHLKRLVEIGAIEKRRHCLPGTQEYDLTPAGRDLLYVALVLTRWLAEAPERPLQIGEITAKTAIKALAEGWSTPMLRALAAGPLSLTELDCVIGPLSYPALERRLTAMRLTGLVKARPADGHRGTPVGVTDWLRRGIAPLTAAIRWERRHLPHTTRPPSKLESEAGFLLATPLLDLPAELGGSCRLAVEHSNGGRKAFAGATVEIRRGQMVACTTQLAGKPDAWALGRTSAWLDAVIDGNPSSLELGGDSRLARGVLESMHRTLFRTSNGDRPAICLLSED